MAWFNRSNSTCVPDQVWLWFCDLFVFHINCLAIFSLHDSISFYTFCLCFAIYLRYSFCHSVFFFLNISMMLSLPFHVLKLCILFFHHSLISLPLHVSRFACGTSTPTLHQLFFIFLNFSLFVFVPFGNCHLISSNVYAYRK